MFLSTNTAIYGLGLKPGEPDEYERVQRILGLGFKGLSIGEPPDGNWLRWRQALAPFAHLSCHAPFADLALLSAHPGIRQVSLQDTLETFSTAFKLRGETVTIHPGQPSRSLAQERTDALMRELLLRIDQEAQNTGVWACWETGTGYFVPLERFDLLRELGLRQSGICLDVQHNMRVWRQINPDDNIKTFAAFIHRYADLIKILHLGDWIEPAPRADGWNDHHLVGRGMIPWPEVFASLVEVGYEGELCLEYHPDSFSSDEELLDNLAYLRALIAEAGGTVA